MEVSGGMNPGAICRAEKKKAKLTSPPSSETISCRADNELQTSPRGLYIFHIHELDDHFLTESMGLDAVLDSRVSFFSAATLSEVTTDGPSLSLQMGQVISLIPDGPSPAGRTSRPRRARREMLCLSFPPFPIVYQAV